MKKLVLISAGGAPISVKIFEPEKSHGKLLLINSATGVKQQLYFGFAKYLAENGFTVITYDYRGIGESKPADIKNFEASMRIWGAQDFRTVTEYVAVHYKNHQKYLLGHSVGALILGMNPDATMFDKFVFVATQDAYFRNLNFRIAMLGLFGFGLLLPMLTATLGYFPAQWFGLGESLPKGVALDWRTLVIHRKSTGRLFAKSDGDYSDDLHQKTLVVYAEDDTWVTMKGMERLMNKGYPNLKKQYRKIRVSESPEKEIGHVNFFRSYNRDLWSIVLEAFSKTESKKVS